MKIFSFPRFDRLLAFTTNNGPSSRVVELSEVSGATTAPIESITREETRKCFKVSLSESTAHFQDFWNHYSCVMWLCFRRCAAQRVSWSLSQLAIPSLRLAWTRVVLSAFHCCLLPNDVGVHHSQSWCWLHLWACCWDVGYYGWRKLGRLRCICCVSTALQGVRDAKTQQL